MPRVLVIAALLLAGAAPSAAARGGPSLKAVLRRMGAYVDTYGERASIVVATERYTQRVTAAAKPEPDVRVTVADFAIIKAAGFGGWVGFRDVVEADGVRLDDHTDRLLRVLSDAAGSVNEAKRLSNESARFNIGPIARDFNVPTAALFFFRRETLERFKFTRKGTEPDGAWEIAFRETMWPSLVRTPEGRSIPSEGTVWVNPADGTVLRTKLRMADAGQGSPGGARGGLTAEVDVSYARVPALGMWLPHAMLESYEVDRGSGWDRTTAEAIYSDYRVFQTSVRIK